MTTLLFEKPYRATQSRPKTQAPDFKVENLAGRLGNLSQKTAIIAGVDEAGRGPLAGPVIAAAVILDRRYLPDALNDSKKLSAHKREEIFERLLKHHHIGFAFAPPARIDDVNIRAATLWAMVKAVRALPKQPDIALIDGRDVPDGLPCPAGAVIKGDALSLSISAASIVAKVMRDRMMQNCAIDAPGFGLESHMGYGTAQHREYIETHGGSRHHRASFNPLRTMLET